MSNTRRATGVPSAFAGKVPPSPDVAERTLADVIGEAVALHLSAVLSGPLARISAQMARPGCIVCGAKAKRAEMAWERDAVIRRQAGEADPPKPDASVTESFTDGARGPVCWGCYDPDVDGPFDFADMLPPAVD